MTYNQLDNTISLIHKAIDDQKEYMKDIGYNQSDRLDAPVMAECALIDVVNFDSEGPCSNNIQSQIDQLKKRS